MIVKDSHRKIFINSLQMFEKSQVPNINLLFDFIREMINKFSFNSQDDKRFSMSVPISNENYLYLSIKIYNIEIMKIIPQEQKNIMVYFLYPCKDIPIFPFEKKEERIVLGKYQMFGGNIRDINSISLSTIKSNFLNTINNIIQLNRKYYEKDKSIHFYLAVTNLIDRQNYFQNIPEKTNWDVIRASKKVENKNNENESKEIERIEENDFESDGYKFDPLDVNIGIEQRSLDSLIHRLELGGINLNTEFQRNFNLWDKSRMSRFIESILLRLPLPAFFFDATDNENWLVIDGLQRLITLKNFTTEDDTNQKPFQLSKLNVLEEYNGCSFEDLPGGMRRRIRETVVTVNLLKPGTPKAVKYSVFYRLNTGGLALNGQEIRNALNQKPNREYSASTLLLELSDTNEFKQVINVSPKRMQDQEIILRFFAFQLKSPHEFENSMSKFLDETMELLNEKSDYELKDLATEYIKVLQISYELFGEHAFSKSIMNANKDKPRINRPLYDVWTYYLSQLSSYSKNKIVENKDALIVDFIKLLKEEHFNKSISFSTSSREYLEYRFSKIFELLRSYSSDYYELKRW
ncbi:MAG: DUF262 domain-containing protein [Leptospiraceae bacterium]|nr:DUF262 domain-containing protein [Leptospiraceae bacterium]MBP6739140.1 DUF262 domain-containing protein [Leptospiraceae bacterium]